MAYSYAKALDLKDSERVFERSEERTNLFAFSVLAILMIFSFTLSVFVFSKESLRLDESQSLWQTSHSPQRMVEIIAEDVHVPLYHILLNTWQILFGNDVATARMLSSIFFLAVIPAMYFLGKKIFGWQAGLLAATFIAISPFLNWYGNEIRMYSLLTLITILNQMMYIEIFRKGREVAENKLAWIGYALTAILGIYTHYFFAFVLITQAIFYFAFKHFFPKGSFWKFVMTALIVILAIAPWGYLVYSMGSASNTQPMLTEPSTINLFNTFSQFIFGFQSDQVNTILLSLWPLLVLLLFLSLRRHQRIPPESAYLFFSLIIPVLLAFVISISLRPIYLTRYLVIALPSLYLLIGWMITIFPRRVSKAVGAIVVASMLITLGIEIVNANTPVKEDYKQASAYLSTETTPQDIVVLTAPFTIYPVEYYYTGPAVISTLPIWDRYQTGSVPPFNQERLPFEVGTLTRDHRVLWLLTSYDQGYEKEIKDYFDNNFEKIADKNFSPGLNLYGYKIKYD